MSLPLFQMLLIVIRPPCKYTHLNPILLNGASNTRHLGNAYRDLPDADLQTAITCYQAALSIYVREQFPVQWANTHDHLARAYYKAQLYQEAIGAAERVLEVDSSISAYDIKVNVLSVFRQYEEALNAYEQAIPLDPYNALFYESEGHILHNLGHYQEALDAFEQAILLDP